MWARIESNLVVEITEIDPQGRFVKEIEQQFITAPQEVKPGWLYNSETGEFSQPEEKEVTFEQKQKTKWEEIKAARIEAEEGGFLYEGVVLDSDADSIQRLLVAAQAAKNAWEAGREVAIEWTAQDNTALTLKAHDFRQLPLVLAEFSSNLHAYAQLLRKQIAKAQNLAELAEIGWDYESWRLEQEVLLDLPEAKKQC